MSVGEVKSLDGVCGGLGDLDIDDPGSQGCVEADLCEVFASMVLSEAWLCFTKRDWRYPGLYGSMCCRYRKALRDWTELEQGLAKLGGASNEQRECLER